MAHLNKLAIRGIRSFDDKQISVIEFFTPVTVIVGHNGSGKTTIIECLKYATTGDQPPNTRGGAFVHDPKMANEKEVKAQVKLRFHAANGKRMLAVRNLSVSQKKAGGLTMKTLENILALDTGSEGGKRAVISTKCAELDTEIPNLLGVSKAVLENVIFCHQEDSYWPLSEPATLKKKFDDIFEATKYTKALDNIKSIRKERIAELKTEKERLDSLQREKTHADKLKGRISEVNASITQKDVNYEAKVSEYNELAISNKKFYELGSKFRDIYQKIDSLEKQIIRYKAEKAEVEDTVQHVDGTAQDLEQRITGFEQHLQQQSVKAHQEQNRLDDTKVQLKESRTNHSALLTDIGQLKAEEKAQEVRIQDREVVIHEISAKQGIKGFDHSPLERDKVLEFLQRLGDLQTRQNADTERLQDEIRTKRDEYGQEKDRLQNKLSALKAKKDSLRNDISKNQGSITDAEKKLDDSHSLPGDLRMLENNIKDQEAQIKKARDDVSKSGYEAQIAERQSKARYIEDQRDQLSGELRTLSLDADARARLDIKRGEFKSKSNEIESILASNNAKYRTLMGSDPQIDIMERELERHQAEKDRRAGDLERQLASANLALQSAESSLSQFKKQLRLKQTEIKAYDKQLKDGIESGTLLEAIAEAAEEVRIRQEDISNSTGAIDVWEKIMKQSKAKRACTACSRHMDDDELKAFEKIVKDQMKKSSPESIKNTREEIAEWASEHKRLQTLLPIEAARNKLRDQEIPELEKQIKDTDASLSQLADSAEEAQTRLDAAKTELKDVLFLKQVAVSITRLTRDSNTLTQDIAKLEQALQATGSTKTADDIQEALDALANEARTNDRDNKVLMQERDRHARALQDRENGLSEAKLKASDLRNQVQQRTHLEESVGHYKKQIASSTAELKEIDGKVAAAQAPIEQLDRDYRRVEADLDSRHARSLELSQQINRDVDKLQADNRAIEKYVREKRGRRLQESIEKSEALAQDIADLSKDVETTQKFVNDLNREIAAGGSTVSNLRENLRIRRLQADIEAIQAEIETYDLDAAAQAKKNFEERYTSLKEKENRLHAEFSAIGGELSSDKSRLKELEKDLKDFKDITKRYTDQLIKVKMSDMANSDLEKYAKALDNAIMKYHSLKMEEVNDIMHHLWNKTYQGTDIDGIKIKYDAEGGATKRSYNYRVVMTKDQVEMDMRGRCSAGQKMLASIIIRLALSDSFGQNCGILALDEPTNALDVENIDALASSLIEVINARKGHGNFQLIIITHDENFLAKLGQSEVMDYYWRVSRDARQKSVIERQRFR